MRPSCEDEKSAARLPHVNLHHVIYHREADRRRGTSLSTTMVRTKAILTCSCRLRCSMRPTMDPLYVQTKLTRQLVELKNSETFNGHLVACDNYMNITMRDVYQTSAVRMSKLTRRTANSFGKCQKCILRAARYVPPANHRSNTVVSPTSLSIPYGKRRSRRASSASKPQATRMAVVTVTGTMVVPAVVSVASDRAHRI